MNIMKKTMLVMGLGFGLVLPVAPAMAQQPLPQPPAASTGTINWAALHLSPEQTRKINLLRLDHNQVAIKLKADIMVRQLEIQKLLIAPAANPNRIRQLMQENLVMKSRLEAASLENFLAIKKVLTAEQLVKLSQLVVIK